MDAELRTASDQRTAWWARAKELESENERLRAALVSIAEQPTSDEMPEAERERAAFREGFDWVVRRARDVLT